LIESNDISLQEKAIKQGAFDVVCKPLSSVLLQAKVQNALIQTKAKTLVGNRAIHLQDEIQNATKVLKNSEYELLEILGKSTNYKEHQESTHTKLIAHYARALARLAGLNEKIQDVAFRASGLYDLGKVAIADEILLKKAKLTDDEFEVVKAHARIGYDLLKYAQNGYLKAAAVISYSHHEKYDGSGYPIGLSGETIPILGRIVAIVDVFEALTSKRVYNELWSVEDACSFLIKEKGKHFDPLFVDLFIDNLDEMLDIKNKLNCTT
ncbi:MAG: HD domain-containing phosphohydrolase, partial [Sulfurimonas sp.]|nr:HD domain-containing phosphohydrolase [Sulfurimonas sp.]